MEEEPSSAFHVFYLFVDVFLSQISFNKLCSVHKVFSALCFSFHSMLGSWRLGNADQFLSHEEAGVDDDDDGIGSTICRDDAEMVMERLGFICSTESEELQDGLGSKEFKGLFDEKEPSLEEVKEAFDVFDENRDGFIDATELQRVLCILGVKEGSDVQNCQKMLSAFDKNADGRLDFNEFVIFMENTSP